MSQRSTLNVAPRKRSGTGALKRLRKEGLVPAIVYGRKFENQNLKVNSKALRDLLARSTSENVLVNLEIEGGGSQLALIQDVQHDALSGSIVHVDFHAVKEDEKIHAQVPIDLTGESIGVKLGGLLEHQIHSLDIFCFPKDLPDKLSVDISHLAMGDALHLSDVKLPEGVTARLGGDVVIALVTEPKVTVEETVVAAAPAVEGKPGEAKAGEAKAGEAKSEEKK
ncbi:MAG: 50S ribosomal protein L25 [Verrucomicrobiales bacterium]